MNGLDAPALAAWGALVLQLHRGSRQWPAHQFQPRAAELLLGLLPAPALWWGGVAAAAADPAAGEVPGGAQGDARGEGRGESRGEAAGARAGEPAGKGGGEAAGEAAGVAADSGPHAAPEPQPGVGLWHGLCRIGDWPAPADAGADPARRIEARCTEPLTGARWLLALWRTAADTPFAAADQAALDFVLPHLVEAWRESTLQALAAPLAPRAAAPGHALAEPDGRLRLADERFVTLLRLEWPWAGRQRLPEALCAALSRANQAPEAAQTPGWQGRRLSALLQARPDGAVQLTLRPRSALDGLSPRRRDIVLRYAAGLTGPQIAAELGLSASTVNNQLGLSFKQLGVRTKLQLRALVDGQGA